ncbi:hypothetical protein QJS66_12880 [Kocuria rhizophila]|nr:hypothetical protein QJS66_12880 [Kocuria rhizophila]
MTQHPEKSFGSIASAGQIDDPDQPTTVPGQGRLPRRVATPSPRRARRTGPRTTGHPPPHPGGGEQDDAALAGSATRSGDRDARAVTDEHEGKPPKALRETGFHHQRARWTLSTTARSTPRRWRAPAGFPAAPGDANPQRLRQPGGPARHRRWCGARTPHRGPPQCRPRATRTFG